MMSVDQLLGNFLVFSFVGWLAMRTFTKQDNPTGVVLLAGVLSLASPALGTSLSAEPVTMVAIFVLIFGVAQYILRMGAVETLSLVALVWVFGTVLMNMTY